MPADEPLELGHELERRARREHRVGPVLHRREPQLFEPVYLGAGERLVRKVGERLAAPEPDGLAKGCEALLCGQAPRLPDERLEPAEVDGVGLDGQHVAGRLRLHGVGAEELAELRDRVLQRRDGRARRLLAPEGEDERVGGDDLSGTQHEHSEERALLRASEGDRRPFVVEDFERAEDPEAGHIPFVTAAASDYEERGHRH